MFQITPKEVLFPELEEEVLKFWKTERIYERSLIQRQGAPRFVFYEGPPTANGMPHPGHCLTRAIKDLFPRYRTMRGYLCERKAGWDTHGLPVEVEVCKELGIHSKEEIEAYGVEAFVRKCQQSVWRYTQAWEQLTERIGFWVDLKDAYATYHRSFVESVWWSLKQLFQRGLLYQGHKIVWWWAQGGTALSAGEVGQGYRTVADPSVYVRFPLQEDTQRSLLVWTTTPWTLPSNQFVAVHPDLDYAEVRDPDSEHRWILARELVDAMAAKTRQPLAVVRSLSGRELLGQAYLPPFDYYFAATGQRQGSLRAGGQQLQAWRVVEADFVTVDTGTGIVHQAPAFGEVDFEVLLREQARFLPGQGPDLICAVDARGQFTDEAPDYTGRWVKDADKDIIRSLRQRGLLVHQEQYEHEYPFCWRAEQDALIQYPRRSWFVRTTKFKEQLLANNHQIGWLPEHIRDGRFGNFLEANVDWALSRERYWGTPLPIWQCEESGYQEAVESFDELLAKPGLTGREVFQQARKCHPELPDDLQVHKPYIDALMYDSPRVKGARMRRVPEVIDCWYDAGSMPFAQWGYPHQQVEQFRQQFPADFISEAIDQTRGWFYSLLAISTVLFAPETDSAPIREPLNALPVPDYPHPFRNCIVLGLMLSEWYESKDGRVYLSEEDARDGGAGEYQLQVGKMSKQKRNYREPQHIFDHYGADALRWYFFANQTPWTSIRYSERAIKESIPEFLLRLWNVFNFFVLYANIDGFEPASDLAGPVDQLNRNQLDAAVSFRAVGERAELDRWILGELRQTVESVTARMDAYDNFGACSALHAFVDALSNWYVRRSRVRFWSPDPRSTDKLDAYWTLFECLVITARLIAPFTPFLAEHLWRTLTGVFGDRARCSVHLCDYPEATTGVQDEALSAQMRLAREICSLGRAARMEQKLKVRQPLAKVEVILADQTHLAWLETHRPLIAEELNVRQVEFTQEAEHYIEYEVRPNFKRLGPRIGKLMPQVKSALALAKPAGLLDSLQHTGACALQLPEGEVVSLSTEDIDVHIRARTGWAAAQGQGCVVVLSTELTPDLIREGIARDLVRHIQDRRKSLNCRYTDRIAVGIVTSEPELQSAIHEYSEFIRGETLTCELSLSPIPGAEPIQLELGNAELVLYVRVSPV